MQRDDLFSEFCRACIRGEKHLSWLQKEFSLPSSITIPFGKAILGLDHCQLHTSGLYTPSPEGHKAIIIAETVSDIAEIKIGITEVIELVAVPISAPNRWFLRTGNGLLLGHENLKHRSNNEPISVHTTPLSWLRGEAKGICVLNHQRTNAWALIRAGPLVFESTALEQKLLYSRTKKAYPYSIKWRTPC